MEDASSKQDVCNEHVKVITDFLIELATELTLLDSALMSNIKWEMKHGAVCSTKVFATII